MAKSDPTDCLPNAEQPVQFRWGRKRPERVLNAASGATTGIESNSPECGPGSADA